MSALRQASRPLWAASHKAVQPSVIRAFTSAPDFARTSVHSTKPSCETACNTVQPSNVDASTSAPVFKSKSSLSGPCWAWIRHPKLALSSNSIHGVTYRREKSLPLGVRLLLLLHVHIILVRFKFHKCVLANARVMQNHNLSWNNVNPHQMPLETSMHRAIEQFY